MIIGITGGSGVGKTLIAKNLEGYSLIDVDQIYHKLLASDQKLNSELTHTFGTADRKKLASIVFPNPDQLQKLNSITFKYILSAVQSELANHSNAIIDATILFESGLSAKCDKTVAVLADKDTRIKRIMERDNLSQADAEMRISAQQPDEFFIKSADIIIHNNTNDIHSAARSLKNRLTPKIAIYGGTFDPPTLGHLDIIRRGAQIFDKLHVVILQNHAKTPVFSIEERQRMLKLITSDISNVEVGLFDGLLADYAYRKDAKYSIRGIRNGFDTEYERPMSEFNAEIAQEEYGATLDTIFIPTTRANSDTSSSHVKMLLAARATNVAKKYLDPRISAEIIKKYRH